MRRDIFSPACERSPESFSWREEPYCMGSGSIKLRWFFSKGVQKLHDHLIRPEESNAFRSCDEEVTPFLNEIRLREDPEIPPELPEAEASFIEERRVP